MNCVVEHNCLILTVWYVAKLRYRGHARKYKPLLHGTESVKRNNTETFYSYMADKNNC